MLRQFAALVRKLGSFIEHYTAPNEELKLLSSHFVQPQFLSLSLSRLASCPEITYMHVNALPHMPTMASSNSAANKDMMSKILTNGDTIF